MYITEDKASIQKERVGVKCDICGKEERFFILPNMTEFRIPELDGYMNQTGEAIYHCCDDVDCFFQMVTKYRHYVDINIMNVKSNLIENLFNLYINQ